MNKKEPFVPEKKITMQEFLDLDYNKKYRTGNSMEQIGQMLSDRYANEQETEQKWLDVMKSLHKPLKGGR